MIRRGQALAASLADLPCIAVPTSLSNDGFCSPQASLTLKGCRRPFRTGLPHAVIVDLDVCRRAPRQLWHSGIGDLTAKLTAVADWKLAFHVRGTPVNDLAALRSDATVHQFLASPTDDEESIREWRPPCSWRRHCATTFIPSCPNGTAGPRSNR